MKRLAAGILVSLAAVTAAQGGAPTPKKALEDYCMSILKGDKELFLSSTTGAPT